MHSAWRRRVTGDKQRIRRLPRVSVIEAPELEPVPRGPEVSVEDALPEVPEIQTRLPFNPARIAPECLVGPEQIADEIAAALEHGRGFSLIRLDVPEALGLNEGMWPTSGEGVDPDRLGVSEDPSATARALREAIILADAVAVTTDRDRFEAARLLERVLFHFDLYPRLRCSTAAALELLGVDRAGRLMTRRGWLLPKLSGRPIAFAGPTPLADSLTWRRRTQLEAYGLHISSALCLDRLDDVDGALLELSAHRDAFDAVLVAGDIPSKPLCSRLANELDVVAVDIGHALDSTIRGSRITAGQLTAHWNASEYLRQTASPPTQPRHEFDGRLVQARGDAAVYYVERGAARLLSTRALLQLFDEPPIRIEQETLDSLPAGVPIFAVHEPLVGTYILIDGAKRPVMLGLQLAVIDEPTDHIALDPRAVRWYPGAERDQKKADEQARG
jgi:hypothetical protein